MSGRNLVILFTLVLSALAFPLPLEDDPVEVKSASSNVNPTLSTAGIVPPENILVEDDIWQYEYPPYSEQNSRHAKLTKGFDSPVQQLVINKLPSYVLGVIDPSELKEENFRPTPAPSPPPTEATTKVTVPSNELFNELVNNLAAQNNREGKSGGSFTTDDDKWIWKG